MYSERRAMFKASPLRFTFMLLLVPVLGLGLLLLLVWYLRCVYQNLEIVDGLIVYKSGVLSKKISSFKLFRLGLLELSNR